MSLQIRPTKMLLSLMLMSLTLSVSFQTAADIKSSPLISNKALDQRLNTAKMFGEQLFQGNFLSTSGSTFTDRYSINIGDNIQVRMWGAYQYAATVTVDSQGYIALPNLAPLKLSGIKNEQLNEVVSRAVKQTYRSNVNVYASLEAEQPVKVFVTGFVNQPGYYSGLASDTVLAFIDRAGGVDARRGSYIDIQIWRSGTLVQQVNLYDFLLAGQLQLFLFEEGDVIHISPKRHTFEVRGAVRNDYIFEYSVPNLTIGDALRIANPKADATHVSIIRNLPVVDTENLSTGNSATGSNAIVNNTIISNRTDTGPTKLYKLIEAEDIPVHNGDILQVIRVD